MTCRFGDSDAPYISAQEPVTRELARFLACANDANERCLSDGWFSYHLVMALEAAERPWGLGGLPVALAASTAAA